MNEVQIIQDEIDRNLREMKEIIKRISVPRVFFVHFHIKGIRKEL